MDTRFRDEVEQKPKPGRKQKPEDPNVDSRIELIRPHLGEDRDKYATGVLAKGGAIYCIPGSASQILKCNFLDMGSKKKPKKKDVAAVEADAVATADGTDEGK